jgi:hypothetical protein
MGGGMPISGGGGELFAPRIEFPGFAGTIGGGGGGADYDPASTAPGLFGNATSTSPPTPGYTNFQVSDAQKASLLAQQQMRDQMVRQQAPQQAPQPAPQQMQQRAMSPLLQQQMARQQQQFMPQQQFRPQQQMGGLQQLLNQMMNRFQPQQRQQRAPMGMPQFRSQALQYRPNMTQAQQSLSRVKPSVQKQEQDANIARIAELEAQLAAQQPQQDPYYGGGG